MWRILRRDLCGQTVYRYIGSSRIALMPTFARVYKIARGGKVDVGRTG
jgi:hypothetical protein